MAEFRAATAEQQAFLADLLDAGLLIASGVPGVYGRSSAFEDVRDAFDGAVTRVGADDGAERLRFPPVVPRTQFEDTGYLKSFPHLAGTIFDFDGSEAEALEQQDRASRHEDWSEFQTMSDLVLVPAACYPVYPAIAARGPLAPGGRDRRRRRRLRVPQRALRRPGAAADVPPAGDRPHRRARGRRRMARHVA